MGFRKLKGVKLPEEMQGLIRYTCLTYREQPEWIRKKIDRLCSECGGEYCDALKEMMCTRRSIRQISLTSFVSETVLYRLRKKFYESWRSL